MAMKIICSHNIAETLYTLKIFQQTCFCLVSQKQIAEMVHYRILAPKNYDNSWNTLKANVCIFLYISIRKFLLHRSSKIWWGGGWVEGWLNNFVKEDCCLGLIKCYIFFDFNWNFWKFKYFPHFVNFNLSLPSVCECFFMNSNLQLKIKKQKKTFTRHLGTWGCLGET